MKLVIASDIHGSAFWTAKLMEAVERETPDHLALLGDILYHGPRNSLPDGYDPKEVTALLNSVAGSIIAVRGNCDAEVDQMMLDFPCLADQATVIDGERTLFLAHGHLPRRNPNDLPGLPPMSAFLSGHTHVKVLERAPLPHLLPQLAATMRNTSTQRANSAAKAQGESSVTATPSESSVVLVNPGSASLPKDGTHSYAVYDNGTFALKTLPEGKILREMPL